MIGVLAEKIGTSDQGDGAPCCGLHPGPVDGHNGLAGTLGSCDQISTPKRKIDYRILIRRQIEETGKSHGASTAAADSSKAA